MLRLQVWVFVHLFIMCACLCIFVGIHSLMHTSIHVEDRRQLLGVGSTLWFFGIKIRSSCFVTSVLTCWDIFPVKILHLFTALFAMACMPRAEDNLQEYMLPFHHLGSGHCTQVIRLGSKYPYLLSHLGCPWNNFSLYLHQLSSCGQQGLDLYHIH